MAFVEVRDQVAEVSAVKAGGQMAIRSQFERALVERRTMR